MSNYFTDEVLQMLSVLQPQGTSFSRSTLFTLIEYASQIWRRLTSA